MSAAVHWTQIPPDIAARLPVEVLTSGDIVFPLIDPGLELEDGHCPWPWEPQQLVGVPMGQYHCGYCGSMELAGIQHSDARRWCNFNAETLRWEDAWYEPLPFESEGDGPPRDWWEY